MRMHKYSITLVHDKGEVTIVTAATDIETAKKMVCEAEGAPVSAVKTWYRIPTKREIEKTKNLLRNI